MRTDDEATRIAETLLSKGINTLYHFTPIGNLKHIAACGCLCTKASLQRRGLFQVVETGGNELSLKLDKDLGNWDKVALYLCPNTPMAYGEQKGRHIVYLLVTIDVATWHGVVFTDTNATRKRNHHRRAAGTAGLSLVDLDIVRQTLDSGPRPWDQTWHRNVQAEVLVPRDVALQHIKAVAFISPASMREGERLWGPRPRPLFTVDPEMFHDGFPLVQEVWLTGQDVNKDNVGTVPFSDRREFRIGADARVTLIAKMKAVPGLRAQIVWKTSSGHVLEEDDAAFEKAGGYWHWSTIDLQRLGAGSRAVDYQLGDIRWVTLDFNVGR